MPVTIGELTSNVTVTDGSGRMSQDDLEKIVEMVIERLKKERIFESRGNQDSTIPDRMSES